MLTSEIKPNDIILVGENTTKVNNIYKDEKDNLLFDCFVGFVRESEVDGIVIPINGESLKTDELKTFNHVATIIEKKIDEFNFDEFKILNGSINCANLSEYEVLRLINQLTPYLDKVLLNDYQVPTLVAENMGNHLAINFRIIQY